jgi:RNA polymerase sigma factor (sigma-70 family)
VTVEERNAIIKSFMSMAGALARKCQRSYSRIDYQEACQEAFVGVIMAVDHYDPNCGTCLATYVFQRIRGRLSNLIKLCSRKKYTCQVSLYGADGKVAFDPGYRDMPIIDRLDIEEALAKINHTLRHVVRQTLAGHDQKTIAISMRRSLNTVKQIFAQAKQKLRNHLV